MRHFSTKMTHCAVPEILVNLYSMLGSSWNSIALGLNETSLAIYTCDSPTSKTTKFKQLEIQNPESQNPEIRDQSRHCNQEGFENLKGKVLKQMRVD